MHNGAGDLKRRRGLGTLAATIGVATAMAACTNPAAAPRPTDPHLIVTDAVRATAALTTLRLHLEGGSSMNRAAFGADVGDIGNIKVTITFDADVDLATRQFAGRQSTSFTGGGNGNGFGMPGAQATDVIATTTAMFVRQGGAGRWTKTGNAGLNVGPTNALIATALIGLLDDQRVTYDKADPVACTLGTCDHVIVHVRADAIGAALAALLNTPVDAASGAMIPDVEVDIRIDQATSIVSELRSSVAMQGSQFDLLLTLANPGDPIQIVAPAPALVDDMMGGGLGGFGGGQVTTILETVGSDVMSPEPDLPAESPTAP